MRSQKSNLSNDEKLFSNVSSIIETKFSFLTTEYNFTLKKDQVIYGFFIYYIREEFTLQMTYGAPEFSFEISIIFPNSSACYVLGEILYTGLFEWKTDWLPQRKNFDKLGYEVESSYIFLRKTLEKLLKNSELVENKLKLR